MKFVAIKTADQLDLQALMVVRGCEECLLLAASVIQSRAAIRMLQPAGGLDITLHRWPNQCSECCFGHAQAPEMSGDPLTQLRWGESRMILGLLGFDTHPVAINLGSQLSGAPLQSVYENALSVRVLIGR
jgi:hypothetical protein